MRTEQDANNNLKIGRELVLQQARSGSYAEAVERASRLCSDNPDSVTALFTLSWCLGAISADQKIDVRKKDALLAKCADALLPTASRIIRKYDAGENIPQGIALLLSHVYLVRLSLLAKEDYTPPSFGSRERWRQGIEDARRIMDLAEMLGASEVAQLHRFQAWALKARCHIHLNQFQEARESMARLESLVPDRFPQQVFRETIASLESLLTQRENEN